MKIDNNYISSNSEPFIIAEMSGNHDQSLEKALKITEMAAMSGAHAVKLQTYTADTMTLNIDNKDFKINDKKSLWYGKNLYDLYELAHTPWEWHEPIMKRAKELGISCFSSPFDSTAVDFLEDLNVPAYKIASFENTDLPLIEKVAMTGKPVIISSGLATITELSESINLIKSIGNGQVCLLKCTSTYPAKASDSNLATIPKLKEIFNCEVGLSDHTPGIGASLAAVGLGASVIEKHFTLDRMDGGVDSAFSLEPDELSNLVTESKTAWESIGQFKIGPTKSEQKSLKYRRSIYVSKEIDIGEKLTGDNIKIIRPGFGLAPKYYNVIIGKKANKVLKPGTPISWEHIG